MPDADRHGGKREPLALQPLEKNNSRLAYGKTITTDYTDALRRAAEICADGYQPGTIERGLLESFAQDPP